MTDWAVKVSVGMPVYNGAAFIEDAVESVLGQTFTDFELLIADNGSTDETESICRRLAERDDRVRYVRYDENVGAARNFNRVFELARGVYFKWFAHDDTLASTYLEACVTVLDESADSVVLCFPQRVVMTHDGVVLGLDPARRWFEANGSCDGIGFLRSLFIPDRRFPELVFGLVRSDVLRKTRLIGAYNFADLVLVTELKLLGEFRHIPEPLFYNRGHDETAAFKVARRTAHGEAEWYDPKVKRGARGATWILLLERLRALHHTKVAAWRIPGCYVEIIVAHAIMRVMPVVARFYEGVRGRIWGAWTRASLSMVSGSGRSLLAYRTWAMAAGVRRFDVGRMILALSWPTAPVRASLYRFAAERLERRNDPAADAVLREWCCGSCPVRRSVADDVMARRTKRQGKESIVDDHADVVVAS